MKSKLFAAQYGYPDDLLWFATKQKTIPTFPSSKFLGGQPSYMGLPGKTPSVSFTTGGFGDGKSLLLQYKSPIYERIVHPGVIHMPTGPGRMVSPGIHKLIGLSSRGGISYFMDYTPIGRYKPRYDLRIGEISRFKGAGVVPRDFISGRGDLTGVGRGFISGPKLDIGFVVKPVFGDIPMVSQVSAKKTDLGKALALSSITYGRYKGKSGFVPFLKPELKLFGPGVKKRAGFPLGVKYKIREYKPSPIKLPDIFKTSKKKRKKKTKYEPVIKIKF